MAAPTYNHKTPATEPGPENNLGGQVVDGNRVAVQGLGSGFVTTDISGTAVTSPVSTSTSVTTLTSPLSAVRVKLHNSDATDSIYVSELSDVSTYFLLKPGDTADMDIGRMGKIYVKASANTPSLSFVYTLVD